MPAARRAGTPLFGHRVFAFLGTPQGHNLTPRDINPKKFGCVPLMTILERLYEVVEVGLRIGDAQSTAKMETIGLDRVRSEVEHGRYLFIGSANFDEHAQLLIGGREVGVLLL